MDAGMRQRPVGIHARGSREEFEKTGGRISRWLLEESIVVCCCSTLDSFVHGRFNAVFSMDGIASVVVNGALFDEVSRKSSNVGVISSVSNNEATRVASGKGKREMESDLEPKALRNHYPDSTIDNMIQIRSTPMTQSQ
ncbi:hypothetical protein KM043_006657 [Ampulex compressa]|nr:hypothetical protein KM043_006657 [Ampulex compressa]